MDVSSIGIIPATSSDLTVVFKRAADSSETTLSQSEKEAIIVVILGVLLSLKGSLTEKIIEDTTDEEIREILKPVQSELQTTYFSWFVIPANVRQALLVEFKKRKEEEEEKKQREEAKSKLRAGKKFTMRELETLSKAAGAVLFHDPEYTSVSIRVDGKSFEFKRQGIDYIKQSIKEKNMGKKFALKNNQVTSELPPSLDKVLQDIAQFTGKISYGDIMDKAPAHVDELKKAIRGWNSAAEADDEEALNEIATKVASILNSKEKNMGKNLIKSAYDYHRFEGKNEACYLVTGDGKWLAGPHASDDTYEFEDDLMDTGKTYEELPEYHGEVNFDPDWGEFTTDDWSSYFKSLQSSKENKTGTIKSTKRLGFFNENTVVYDDGSTEVYRQGAGWIPGENVKDLEQFAGYEGIIDWFNEQKGKIAASKSPISSARGEVTDSTRQLVRDILAQVPSLVKVPERQQGIKKEPYGPDHVCYFYSEEGPRKGSFVTVEFHVDPSDLYTDIFVTTRASFAAAADGGEARQDEREITLDEFVIEDLEDYSLADIDKIDAAVEKGFEGAQKFDEQAASTLASRKALFSSKHKQFVASFQKTSINSSYAEYDEVVQLLHDLEDRGLITADELSLIQDRIDFGELSSEDEDFLYTLPGKEDYPEDMVPRLKTLAQSRRIASSLENEVDHWVNTVGCISEMSEDERNDLQAVADHVASKIENVESLGYSDDPEDSTRLVNDVANIIQKNGWLVSSGKKKIYSDIPGLERYIQELMDEEGLTREEAEAEARERISIGL